MIRFLLSYSLLLTSTIAFAQIPSTCFEIESILVDACAIGSNCNDASDPACDCEGKNEMFRFKVGPDDLNTADMEVDWPNGFNDWLGICQNATTAQHVADLNATILNCGWLLEPLGGVLPAGEDVIVVGSTDMCVVSNSFAGLSDTLMVIFQCPGNYFGHFANQNNGSNNFRTLGVNFGQDCEDEVTYDRSLLLDQSGLNTPEDGATVNFTWEGDDSYVNNGCNAPVEQNLFDAGDDVILCPGGMIQLEGTAPDTYTDLQWSGGNGTFSNPNGLTTTYTPSEDDPEEFYISFTGQGCNGFVGDELLVQNLSIPLSGISTNGGTAICQGQTLTLTAEGTGIFEWSTSEVAPSIEVSEAGTYTVTVENSCGAYSESIDVTVEPLPTVDILNPIQEDLCEGESVLLDATGTGGTITWSTMETGAQIEVDTEGWYYASISNDCAVISDSTELIVIQFPEVAIDPAGPVELCEGAVLELTATGIGDFVWSTAETSSSITIDQTGTYTVQADNQCGTADDEVEILFGGFQPQAMIEADDVLLCIGENITLNGSGGDSYLWNGAASGPDLSVDTPGLYTLTAQNDCGEDEASILIQEDEVPLAQLIDGPVYAICNGEAAIVQVQGDGTFTWSDGGVANSNAFLNTGNYYVVAQAACGTDTAFFQVVTQDIDAQVLADPVEGEAPLTVQFINETSNATEVEWVFHQGQTSSLEDPIHTFWSGGTYEVVLTATTELGCESRTTIIISVGACPFTLFIPSAFTPNADGYNDQMRAEGNCINLFEWHIYDRWGREVYYSTDPNESWSGADVSGYAVTDGEYPYWIQVLDSNGVPHRFEGSITVIR